MKLDFQMEMLEFKIDVLKAEHRKLGIKIEKNLADLLELKKKMKS